MKLIIAVIIINMILLLWNYAAHKFDDIEHDNINENETKNKKDR